MIGKRQTSALESVTLGVSDIDEALRLFRDTMGYRVDSDYVLTPSVRTAWRLGPEVTGRVVELSYQNYHMGRVRLATFNPTPTVRVRCDHGRSATDSPTDVGPKAIDIYVRPPIQRAMRLLEGLGYEKRADPVRHQVGEIISEELVYWGPDGVPILLMVGHVHPADQQRAADLPGEFSEIATVSIVSEDRDRSRMFYRDLLGLHCFEESESAPSELASVSTLTGVPSGSRIHWEMYGDAAEPSGKILLLNFFERTGKRLTGRMRPGHLGFSMMSVTHPDLDALASETVRLGFEVITSPCSVDVGHPGGRRMLIRGPNEELFEVIEHPITGSQNGPSREAVEEHN